MFPVLFLQPRHYFERLGFDFTNMDFSCEFGVTSLYFLEKKIRNYQAIVTCIDHSIFSRSVCAMANERMIPSILVMDGVFDWANATSNPYLKKINIKLLSPFIYSSAMVVDKGLYHYLSSNGVRCEMYVTDHQNEIIELKRRSGVLITTANTPYFCDEERQLLCELITEVVCIYDELGINYRFRIYDEYLIRRFAISPEQNDVEESFEKCVSKYSGLVTTPSSVAQTAMSMCIPVGLFDYRDTPVFLNAGWRIHKSCNIKNTVLSMQSLDKDRMAYQADSITTARANDSFNMLLREGYLNRKAVPNYADLALSPFVISLEYPVRKILILMRKYTKVIERNLLKRLGK
jgi:hypothetical protein